MTGVSGGTHKPSWNARYASLWCRIVAVAGLTLTAAGLVISPQLWWTSAASAEPPDMPATSPLTDGGDAEGSPSTQTPQQFPHTGEPLADVLIEGNETIPASAIARYIKTQPGRAPSDKQIREDVRSLYGTRWFFSVEPRYRRSDKGLVLIYKVLERPIVRKVEYQGNDKIKTKLLAEKTGLKTGSPFDVSKNREAARRLEDYYHEKGFTFATVELEKGGSKEDRDVVFRIREGNKVRVTKITFTGNEFFSNALLNMKLRTKKAILWLLGGLYDPATIPDDVAALKQYYHSLGFFDVQIDHKVTFNKKKSRAYIEYQITEGPRYKVRNIEVTGNHIFDRKELLGQMELVEGDFFDARTLSKDVETIKAKYGALGHLFAGIDAVPQFLEQPGVADLVYRIDEDRKYTVRRINIHIQGDNPHTKTTVARNIMRVAPGDPADPRLIRLSRTRLGGSQVFERGPGADGPRINITRVAAEQDELAGERQFRFQNASEDSETADGVPRTDQAEVQHDTRFGQPSRSPSDGTGHSVLSQYGAEREWRTLQSQKLLREQQLRLRQQFAQQDRVQRTGVRAGAPATGPESRVPTKESNVVRSQNPDDPLVGPPSPLFGTSPEGDPFDRALRAPPGQVDLDVFLTEARTGRLMFGVGVNSDAGVVGSIVLSEQNFDILRPPTSFEDFLNGQAWRGGGQRFRMEAVPGDIVSRYLISWSDPYFLDTDFTVGVSGFFYNRFFRDWDEQRGGGRVNVGYQITPELSVSGALRLEEVNIDNPDFPTPPILLEAVGSSFLSTFRATAAHDTRDAPFLPGEGHYVELSFEQAFGEFLYPRAEAEARQYFTLYARPDGGGRHIVMIGGQLGWTDVDTPIFERFFGGGFQSFRGFEYRGVGPEMFNVKIGGRWQAIGTVEYMFPLVVNETLQGVLFSDFGTVEEDVGFDEFRVTVGAGLRVSVPAMGPVPLAFDFAFPLVDQKEDETQVFSFYVGFTR